MSKLSLTSLARRRMVRSSLFCGIFLAASGPLAAQSTFATIQGTVLDASGAVVPDAVVTVKNEDTGTTETVRAGAAGEYRLFDLNAGTFTLVFNHAGFGDQTVAHQVVLARQVLRLDGHLDAGAVATTVDVEAGNLPSPTWPPFRTRCRAPTSTRSRSTSAPPTTPRRSTSPR